MQLGLKHACCLKAVRSKSAGKDPSAMAALQMSDRLREKTAGRDLACISRSMFRS